MHNNKINIIIHRWKKIENRKSVVFAGKIRYNRKKYKIRKERA